MPAYLVTVVDGDPVTVQADSLVVEAGALLVNRASTDGTQGKQDIFASGMWRSIVAQPDPPADPPDGSG